MDLGHSSGAAVVSRSRIATFGTSLTSEWTWRVWRACGGHWVRLLRTELQSRVGESAIVANFGHWGADSTWARHRVTKLGGHLDVDVALVEYAVNDADMRRGISLADSRRNQVCIAEALRARWPRAALFFIVTNPCFGRHAIDRPRLEGYYDVVRDVASEAGAGLIDLVPAWQIALEHRRWQELLPDGIHPGVDAAMDITLPKVLAALQM